MRRAPQPLRARAARPRDVADVVRLRPRGFALLVVATALALTGCQGETDAGEDDVQALVVWTDEDRADSFTDLLAAYTTSTGVPVVVEGQPSETLRASFLQAVPTGRGPDVLVGAHDWLGELTADGAVLPVDLDDDAFVPAAVRAVTYEGDVFGVPLSTENVALVRNDALTTAEPATFDELVAEGERVVATGAAARPLLVQQGELGDPYHLYPLQTSFGAPVFATDETGSYTADLALGGDGGRAFADYLAALGARGVLDPAVTADVARDEFAAGRAPFVVTGPWNVATFADAGIDFTVLPVPPAGPQAAQPFVGVQMAFVSRATRQEAQAIDLLGWLGTEEVQTHLYELSGRAPAVRAAVDAIGDDPVVRGFAEAGADGAPMPAIPQMSVVWTFWGNVQQQIVTGGAADVHAAWDGMVAGISAAMTEQ